MPIIDATTEIIPKPDTTPTVKMRSPGPYQSFQPGGAGTTYTSDEHGEFLALPQHVPALVKMGCALV